MSFLQPNDTVLFIGDSITDAGRCPSGEISPWEAGHGLGTGYVSHVWAWLTAARPELRIRVVNRGSSGHTVRDLAGRWDADVIARKPDVLCVMIGINDVWRQFDGSLPAASQVMPDEYRATYAKLLEAARAVTGRIVTAGPYYLEPNREDPMRRRMDEYSALARDAAEAAGARFVDTQAAFDAVMRHIHPTAIAWDRIHPGPHGHMVIARAFLRAFGLAD